MYQKSVCTYFSTPWSRRDLNSSMYCPKEWYGLVSNSLAPARLAFFYAILFTLCFFLIRAKQKVNERELETSCKDNLLTVWLIEFNLIHSLLFSHSCEAKSEWERIRNKVSDCCLCSFFLCCPIFDWKKAAKTAQKEEVKRCGGMGCKVEFNRCTYTLRFFPVHLLSNSQSEWNDKEDWTSLS